MAGSRKSGTRSLAPVSGSVLTSNVPFISQNDTTTVILSSSTNIQGVLKVVRISLPLTEVYGFMTNGLFSRYLPAETKICVPG